MTSKIHRSKAHRRNCLIDAWRRCPSAALWLAAFGLLFAWQKVGAQLAPADDFFNSGAQFYISNNVPAALERVEGGLKAYPDDEKLKKLEQLLKQQQQQQQQNQQQQNQQNQQQQSKNDQQKKSDEQKKQDQQQQNQQQNPQQQKQDQQNQADQKKAEEQKQQEQKQDSGDKSKDEKQAQQQQGQPVKPGEMTPEEAKHLLDAQKDNEQVLQLKPKDKPEQSQRPVKDW
jgi:Ca-activated chloride channel family protein